MHFEAVQRAAGGDLDAFADVIRRFQHMAFGYALSLVRNFQEAEDVVQEAFLAAWYALPTLAEPAAPCPAIRFRKSHTSSAGHLAHLPTLSSPDFAYELHYWRRP